MAAKKKATRNKSNGRRKAQQTKENKQMEEDNTKQQEKVVEKKETDTTSGDSNNSAAVEQEVKEDTAVEQEVKEEVAVEEVKEEPITEKDRLLAIIEERIEFFTSGTILDKVAIAKRAEELAKLAIAVYKLGDKTVLNKYLNMCVAVPGSIGDIRHTMDTVIKNGNIQRNAVGMMQSCMNKLARHKSAGTKAKLNIAAVKEDISSQAIVNFIASKS